MVVSLWLLGLAVRTLPLGTAYAIWTGIGTVGTVIVGILLFDEPANGVRLACVALIVSGIVGLKACDTVRLTGPAVEPARWRLAQRGSSFTWPRISPPGLACECTLRYVFSPRMA